MLVGTAANSQTVSNSATDPTIEAFAYKIQEMKSKERGPFDAIKWFCNDGSVLPARAGCSRNGGGIQHGMWTEDTKQIRDAGFPIANVFARITPQERDLFRRNPDELAFILLERFLVNFDDGWIFRLAQTYRGAFQIEDETAAATQILLTLLSDPLWRTKKYFLIREAARLLPRDAATEKISFIRSESTVLGNSFRAFMPIRNKIHSFPDPDDATRVREFADNNVRSDARDRFYALAAMIDQIYSTSGIRETLVKLFSLPDRRLAEGAAELYRKLDQPKSADELYEIFADFLVFLRENLERSTDTISALSVITATIPIEQELFVIGRELSKPNPTITRNQWLRRLTATIVGLYGSGLISEREYRSVRTVLAELDKPAIPIETLYRELSYLSVVPSWAAAQIDFDYGPAKEKFIKIEKRIIEHTPDRLRQSSMLLFSQVLEIVLRDVSSLAGLEHSFFGSPIGSGLRALNPGVARGILVKQDSALASRIPSDKTILLASATSPEMPNVSGVITGREGNLLSHVQLLSRNLGIPNVVASDRLLAALEPYVGQELVLIATPRGSVQIYRDSAEWDRVLKESESDTSHHFSADLRKLDLAEIKMLPLTELRSRDSGRTVGPKAAQLGELKYRFPEYVTEGFAIPFGIYRRVLDAPYINGPTMWEWLSKSYRTLAGLDRSSNQYNVFLKDTLRNASNSFLAMNFSSQFTSDIELAMKKYLGPVGTYGVFIRSDSNVEDLPNFTGAGLNLTVPNVVDFRQILHSIRRVWASCFTERAFSWRQAAMKNPEHVYMSVLVMKSVPADKSGVLVTADIETNDPRYLTIASNEGVGGVVNNQHAETVRIDRANGTVRLYSSAAAHRRNLISASGGLNASQIYARDQVLTSSELLKLASFAKELPKRFPEADDWQDRGIPAEIEFGFVKGKLALFQIRPFLQSVKKKEKEYLQTIDNRSITVKGLVNMVSPPRIELN